MKPAVLIVDDDLDIQEMIAMILDAEGYRTLGAANGRAALEVLRGEDVGLVLLDMMMPVMDGRDFRTEQLREPRFSKIPVVVLTGDGRAREKAGSLGANGYLTKPIDVDDLLDTVAKHQSARAP